MDELRDRRAAKLQMTLDAIRDGYAAELVETMPEGDIRSLIRSLQSTTQFIQMFKARGQLLAAMSNVPTPAVNNLKDLNLP